jgi:hypothetical protein
MDHQYPTTPCWTSCNDSNLVCPPPPQPRKPSIMFDGTNVMLPFQLQLSSESDCTSVVDGPERVVYLSLKPRSSFFTHTESEGVTTKVTIDSFPPPPFGCTPPHEMVRSSYTSKLPSQVRRRSFIQAEQNNTFNARCA